MGATSLYKRITEEGSGKLPEKEEVTDIFKQAVRSYFTKELERPELLGRIGNGVLAFDIVRPEYLDQVVSKFLDQLVASAARKGLELQLERESILAVVHRHMTVPENMALGYREVRNVLDRVVRDPLIDAVHTGSRQGTYAISVPPGEETARVRPGAGRPLGAADRRADHEIAPPGATS